MTIYPPSLRSDSQAATTTATGGRRRQAGSQARAQVVSSAHTQRTGSGSGQMGAENGSNNPSSTVLDGLYGVQLGRPSDPAQTDGGASSSPAACEHHHKRGRGGTAQAQQRLQIRRLWQHRPSCFKPIHCTITCDKHAGETVANVVTSLPFIVLGLQAPRKNLNAAIYANSLVGMGVASSLYHSSRGGIRRLLRWADYTMIATTTLCLSRAVGNENPRLLMAASALLLPFQPLVVSAVHTGLMEASNVSFARRASMEPELRMAHNLHKVSSLLGGALFIADDCFPETPYIHAAWHLAAAIGVGTCNKLLE
ncbi:uncharacterized protein [Zea mays]|uniref:uncharacterized protein isoform X6 n=1 Tax=Zea mays TaxID=4577 RepID=UPI0016521098|nr:uncharacterized protein LOC100272638 isoform X6 [Zea mays]